MGRWLEYSCWVAPRRGRHPAGRSAFVVTAHVHVLLPVFDTNLHVGPRCVGCLLRAGGRLHAGSLVPGRRRPYARAVDGPDRGVRYEGHEVDDVALPDVAAHGLADVVAHHA